jgi:hypothetical protein
VIHLGGEAAVVVPVADFLRLQALQRHTSAEELEEAEIEATLAAHQAWVAAGRPGAVSHEEAMAELLGGRDATGELRRFDRQRAGRRLARSAAFIGASGGRRHGVDAGEVRTPEPDCGHGDDHR